MRGLFAGQQGQRRGNQAGEQDEQAQQDLTAATQAQLKRKALNNELGYGFWDTPMGLASGLLGNVDAGTAQTAAGLEQLRSLGTVQNRLNAENRLRELTTAKAFEDARRGRGPGSMAGLTPFGRGADSYLERRIGERTPADAHRNGSGTA